MIKSFIHYRDRSCRRRPLVESSCSGRHRVHMPHSASACVDSASRHVHTYSCMVSLPGFLHSRVRWARQGICSQCSAQFPSVREQSPYATACNRVGLEPRPASCLSSVLSLEPNRRHESPRGCRQCEPTNRQTDRQIFIFIYEISAVCPCDLYTHQSMWL